MDEGLLPCPFCGGEAEQLYLEDEANFGGSVISCTRCEASSAVHFDRKENLVSSWNERAAPAVPAPDKAQEEVARAIAETFFGRFIKRSDDTLTAAIATAVSTAHASGREQGERAMRDAAVAEIKSLPLHTVHEIARRIQFLPIPSPAQERGE